MANYKILIVEDDPTLAEVLKFNLVKQGYNVLVAADGLQGLTMAQYEKPDLMLLDLMLPKMDGFEVCRIIRQESILPILILTAKTEEVDKVIGLEMGADDYLTKPFQMRELIARVRAMIRRSEMTTSKIPINDKIIKVHDIEIDTTRHLVTLKGKPLALTPKEFELLTFLASHKGIVFNREQLLEKVWGYEYAGDTRTVDVHVRWLRGKIEENPDSPKRLLTIRSVGYKLEG